MYRAAGSAPKLFMHIMLPAVIQLYWSRKAPDRTERFAKIYDERKIL